ncbi:DUF2252 domain-containing protein [Streptomyces genisteinicus]|uniref:DUF2252 domain-containing protein n=1 Tax=Streptomyces genisteinicus TaxID=2768068 RepID=A0A7H0I2J8_9ACTN|nr:DUF2252 family protein [Streptomyces genisteinicus]QNP67014.1 DUF2252 domain-containing protein [Streptomyces genisteinicus]
MTAHRSPEERAAAGRAARKRLPRSSHGAWIPSADRPDPVATLRRQDGGRVPELLPLRYARMAASPGAFLRGAAAVTAADLAALPHSGLVVQLCGDAHLLNFGLHTGPDGTEVIDVDDLGETFPGPFEWDVKRLAASVAVTALDNGHDAAAAGRSTSAAVLAYRSTMRRLAGLGELAAWYGRVDTRGMPPSTAPGRGHREGHDDAEGRRTELPPLRHLSEAAGGRLRFVAHPPVLQPARDADRSVLLKTFADHRSTLAGERRRLLGRFHAVDAARTSAGVAGVGVPCFVVLLEGRDAGDPLFVEFKEAAASVLEAHLGPGPHPHAGRRVVAGSCLVRAVDDPFLGWVTGPQGRHFTWRRLNDVRGPSEVPAMSPAELRRYAALCGAALGRAHARGGDRIALAVYLGAGDSFDRAVRDFALRYADRTAADRAALLAALSSGTLPAACRGGPEPPVPELLTGRRSGTGPHRTA